MSAEQDRIELLEVDRSMTIWETRETNRAVVSRRRTVLGVVVAVGLVAAVCAVCFLRSPGADAQTTDPQDFTGLYEALGIDPAQHELKHSNYSSAGLPKELVRNLQLIKKKKTGNKKVRELNAATCAIDITHATLFLQRAGLAITAATATCRSGKSAHVTAACAADMTNIMASLSFVAEYISEAVLMCAQTINVQARCWGGIAGIVGNIGRLATEASFMAGNCYGGAAFDKPVAAGIWQQDRRLQGDNSIQPSYDQTTLGTYTCFLDAAQAANYLADFGVFIDGAVKSCSADSNLKMWPLPKFANNLQAHKVYCAMNLLDVLEGVYMATAFISSAVAHCQPVTNQQALCASGVAGLTGALTGMSKSILNTYGACERDPVKKIVSPKYRSAEAVTAWNDYTGNK